jgi:pyruvate/2-oxoglutarate dehydrogenase complex dihydrolipoamide dehydrogenase (E3) component
MTQLHDTYSAWKSKSEEGRNVTFKLGHEVVQIKERSDKGVVVEFKTPEGETKEGRFDELILAVGGSLGEGSEADLML